MKNNIINTIYGIIKKGKNLGIGQLYTDDYSYDNNLITVNQNKLVNFGSYSYFGMEHDERLKDEAISAIQRFGIQFPSSRTYVSSTLYRDLEKLLSEIFETPIVMATTTTLAHVATIPVALEEGDVILMDQQVHSSVQFMISHMKQSNIPTHIIRHNNMDQLEKKIKELSVSYKRIWYMFDGVYSMYGDTAPITHLERLLGKYKKLHLYADDAHGMSWVGKKGCGYVLSKMKLHQRMIVVTSLNKAFASGGALIVTSNTELASKISTCGAPLIFAGQLQSSALGAGIACAKIHLSNEINIMQEELLEKIMYCHDLLIQNNLPVISNGETPIFFIGAGLPKVGYNLVKKMIESGYYVNLAIFPAVSETCTGIRFTIIRNHTYQQIEDMVKNLSKNFKQSLIEEQRTLQDIHKAFCRVKTFYYDSSKSETKKIKYSIQHETSISKISKNVWDSLLGSNSTFDWVGLVELETIFQDNLLHNNWSFHYLIIRDENNVPVFATYATICLTKEDTLSSASISYEIEQKRQDEPYYLCSKTLMLGCPLSIGQHYYIKKDENWQKTFLFFIEQITMIQEKEKVKNLNLRDFLANQKMENLMADQGFIKVKMPSNHILKDKIGSLTIAEYLLTLKSSQRYYIKKRAIKNELFFTTDIISSSSPKLEAEFYDLYLNVQKRSFELNLFEYPEKLISHAVQSEKWDVLAIKEINSHSKYVAMACSYVSNGIYHFILAGLDYLNAKENDTYSQLLWQIVLRANQLNCHSVDFGLTTGQNKRKFGAEEEPLLAFVQMKDNYNASIINNIPIANGYIEALSELRL